MLSITSVNAAVATLIGSPLTLILLLLGVYGWRRLIAVDSIFKRQREWFFHRFPFEGFSAPLTRRPVRGEMVNSSGIWYVTEGTFLGELLSCPWCLSWWIAVAQFGAFLVWPTAVLALTVLHTGRIVTGVLAHHFG